MRNYVAIHEDLMNESGFILPRVGVGVRGGVRGGYVGHPSMTSHPSLAKTSWMTADAVGASR